MSYQVLARKWRPKNFAELMGQEHVVKALTGGLQQGRLHHAFLFTGTRGVGKTTIARIIAKALNCETGITATPCGQCSTCLDIDAGRYTDLMEIDAASRTKVDDTRELLDNVVYAPARGRFKVYLIDEVHMLSINSFNALLKTLEEPPEHVKFVLATTDPQKLPITVLSRCLKFHLKRLSVPQIDAQMQKILAAEQIEFDAEAVSEIARAADGSMRDGLSLLDQALAFGQGKVQTKATLEMLGTVSSQVITTLLEALAKRDVNALFPVLQQISQMGANYAQVLGRLAEQLHQLAFMQALGDAWSSEFQDESHDRLKALRQAFDPEDLQLKFQFALLGSKDLYNAPDPKIAFEMCMLRMLAFTNPEVLAPPVSGSTSDGTSANSAVGRVPVYNAQAAPAIAHTTSAQAAPAIAQTTSAQAAPAIAHTTSAQVASAIAQTTSAQAAPAIAHTTTALVAPASEPIHTQVVAAATMPQSWAQTTATELVIEQTIPTGDPTAQAAVNFADERSEAASQMVQSDRGDIAPTASLASPALVPETIFTVYSEEANQIAERWRTMVANLQLPAGPLRELARIAVAEVLTASELKLAIDPNHELLASANNRQALVDLLRAALPEFTQISVQLGSTNQALSPRAMDQRAADAHQVAFEQSLQSHPLVQSLVQQFAAVIVPGSIRSNSNSIN